MQLFHGAPRLIDVGHQHEAEPFRPLRSAMRNDLCIPDLPDAFEKLEQIVLGGVVGKVADVEFRRGDFDRFRLSTAELAVAASACGRFTASGFWAASEERHDLLPQALLGRRGCWTRVGSSLPCSPS